MGKGIYCLVLSGGGSSIRIGAIGEQFFPQGYYVYAGSALGPGGLQARVGRHIQTAKFPGSKTHWHIDHLLLHPDVEWAGSAMAPDGDECVISRRIAEESGVTVPVEGFGSSDCRSGCKAHLYRLPEKAWRPGFARWIKDPKV